MADIFISYKREDKKKAALLAEKLEASGWDVWWDHDLLGGEDYDVAIERELLIVKCVIVIWSALSVQSRNVKDEAKKGLNRNILVPVSFDGTEPPIGFGMTQVVSFENSNRINEEEYAKLYKSVVNKVGKHVDPHPPPGPKPGIKSRKYWWGALVTIGLGITIYFIVLNSQNRSNINPDKLQADTAAAITTEAFPEVNTQDNNTVSAQTEREKIEEFFKNQGRGLEPSRLMDTITYFRIKQITQNTVTVEVDYSYDTQHGAVYLGAWLWQLGKDKAGGGYQGVFLSSQVGTAEITITLSDIKSPISSEGLLVFMNEAYKAPFHARIFDFKHNWLPASSARPANGPSAE